MLVVRKWRIWSKYCFASSFCSSFLVGLLHDFQILYMFDIQIFIPWNSWRPENSGLLKTQFVTMNTEGCKKPDFSKRLTQLSYLVFKILHFLHFGLCCISRLNELRPNMMGFKICPVFSWPINTSKLSICSPQHRIYQYLQIYRFILWET